MLRRVLMLSGLRELRTHYAGNHGDVDEDVHAQHRRRRAVDALPLARLHGFVSAIGTAACGLPPAMQAAQWGAHAPRAINGQADVKTVARLYRALALRPACGPRYTASPAGDSSVCQRREEGPKRGFCVCLRVVELAVWMRGWVWPGVRADTKAQLSVRVFNSASDSIQRRSAV